MKLENISEAFVQTNKKTGKGIFFDSRASIGEVFNATPEDVKKAIAKVRKSHEMKRVLDMGYTDVTSDTNIKNGTIHIEKSSGSFKEYIVNAVGMIRVNVNRHGNSPTRLKSYPPIVTDDPVNSIVRTMTQSLNELEKTIIKSEKIKNNAAQRRIEKERVRRELSDMGVNINGDDFSWSKTKKTLTTYDNVSLDSANGKYAEISNIIMNGYYSRLSIVLESDGSLPDTKVTSTHSISLQLDFSQVDHFDFKTLIQSDLYKSLKSNLKVLSIYCESKEYLQDIGVSFMSLITEMKRSGKEIELLFYSSADTAKINALLGKIKNTNIVDLQAELEDFFVDSHDHFWD